MTWVKYALMGTLLVAVSLPSSIAVGQDAATGESRLVTSPPSTKDAVAKVRAAVTAAMAGRSIPAFGPPLEELSQHRAGVGDCDYITRLHRLCRRGDRSGSPVIVLFGDSHARHWIPALDKVALRAGYAAYYLVKPGCNAADTLRSHEAGVLGCVAFRAWAAKQIAILEPELLVITGDMPSTTLNVHGRLVRDDRTLAQLHARGLVRAIRPLKKAVGRVVIVGDTPGLRIEPQVCLSDRGNDLGDCTFSRTVRSRLELRAAQRAASRTNTRYVDPTRWFCFGNHCPTIVDHMVTYRDRGHVLPRYSRSLAPSLAAALGL